MDTRQVVGDLAGEECGAMTRVAKIHFEVMPEIVFVDAHIPWARYIVGELPEDVVALFVGKPFSVGLQNGVAALPKVRAQGVQSVAAVDCFRALQMLEGVNGLHFRQEAVKPLNAGLGLAVLHVFEEIGDLILAGRTVVDGVPLENGDLNFIGGSEQQ